MTKELICINCPLGCRLTVELNDSEVKSVTGNNCERGVSYAVQEAVRPMRILTGNMKIKGQESPLSVKTNKPIPKSMLLSCANELKRHHPSLPVRIGDVLLENLLGTGANVVATQNIDKI